MIVGHFGVASLVRAMHREQDGTIAFLALCGTAVLPDVIDIVLAISGTCSPYGFYSHTLPSLVLQAAIAGGTAYLITGSRAYTLAIIAVIALHLGADFFTMRKLVMPGGELHGLGYYEHPMLDLALESPAAVAGWWALRRTRRGPKFATTIGAIVMVVTIQTALDGYILITGKKLKPSACFDVSKATS